MSIIDKFRDAMIGDDPAPEYSRLDSADGLQLPDPEPDLSRVLKSLPQLTGNGPDREQARTILTTLIPALWDAVPETADGYDQARRIASVVLHRDLHAIIFDEAMEACAAIFDLEMGGCLVHMYGDVNTDQRRDYWADYERMNLTCAIQNLTGAIPERRAAL